jgi:hypothetical protein
MSDQPDDSSMSLRSTDSEIKELMGLFDAPAFARRGRDVEWAISRTMFLCRRKRLEFLDMVHCRLRMWVSAAGSQEPHYELWSLADAPAVVWKPTAKLQRKALEKASLGLIQSVERFNDRWYRWVHELNTETVNRQIDHFNKYYILEKECVVGSARLAARLFQPAPRMEPDWILQQLPLLPVPKRIGS